MFAFVLDRRLVIVVLCLFILMFAVPAFAQEVPSDPPVADEEPSGSLLTSDEANRLLEDAGNSIAVGAGGSLLVLLIVQILKFVPMLKTVRATDLSFLTALVLVVIGAIANQTGYGATFDDSARFTEMILPPIITIVTAVLGSGFAFNTLQRAGADPNSLLARSRTPQPLIISHEPAELVSAE